MSWQAGRLLRLTAVPLAMSACLSSPPGADAPCSSESCPSADAAPSPLDAATDAEPCDRNTFTVTAEADGHMDSGGGADQPKGEFDHCTIGGGDGATGLFRFDMTAWPTGVQPLELRLQLTYVEKSPACDCPPLGTCESCDCIEQDGSLLLFFARNDWDETAFTYNLRALGQEWDMPGAGGVGMDRSAQIASLSHVARSSSLLFTVTDGDVNLSTLLGDWIDDPEAGPRLTLLVEGDPVGPAKTNVATKETSATCGVAQPAQIEIDYCQ